MDQKKIEEAARHLVEARQSGVLLDALPPSCRPASVEEAHAIQDAVTTRLGERVGAWKVNAPPGEATTRAAIFARLIFSSPARIPAHTAPLLCIEGEIAFRFLRDLPPRAREYSRKEVSESVEALPAIEIVDSRFRDLNKASPLERLADHIANGAFVHGAPVEAWRALDLRHLHVTLTFDGSVVVDKSDGHPLGDPLHPAVALVNHLRTKDGVSAGQIVTTGSCTGMTYAKPGQRVDVRFEGLGNAEVTFTN